MSSVNKKLISQVSKDNELQYQEDQIKLLLIKEESDKTSLEVLRHCSNLGIWKWNLETNEVSYDQRWCEMLGYQVDELAHNFSTFERLVNPTDLQMIQEKVKNYLEGVDEEFEIFLKLRHKDGFWVNVLSKGKSFKNKQGKPQFFCGTHFDISYVKKMEEKAEKINQLSDEVQRMAKIGAWEVDVVNNELIWTDETYRIHEIAVGTKLKVEDGINFYIEKDRTKILGYVNDCMKKKISFFGDFQIIATSGKVKWVRTYGEAICDEIGVAVKIRGTFQDISYQKDLELSLLNKNKALSLKEKDLETIIQCTYDGIWDWHIDRNYEYMSPRFWEMLGYDPKEKKHDPKEWEALIFPEDLVSLNQTYKKHLLSKGKEVFFQEIRFNHKSGHTVWVLCRGQVVSWDVAGNPLRMVGAHTDITQLKETQIRLQESSRLIALGEMAGGVAHEINNPLAIINSSAEALARVIAKQDNINPMSRKFIENIQHTVTRISKIVDGLRKLSRQGVMSEMEDVKVQTVVMDSLSLCTEKFKSQGVELVVDMFDDFSISCRPIELSQVIINLLNNAYHSLRKQKDASIFLRIIDRDAKSITIEIEDNGHGIPDSIKEKIMQPFFTTKPAGEGTGIGLSISREIIDSMGGVLRLGFSSPSGSCFCIDLKKSNSDSQINVA